MEILAGLIKISPGTLPVPWYNRPALGLVTGTGVTLGFIKSNEKSSDQSKRPPDLIVTPLSVQDLQRTCSITIDTTENPGSIRDTLQNLDTEFNISLMESVTIDQRSRHRLTIVVQPQNRSMDKETFDRKIDSFLKSVECLSPAKPYFLANENIEIGKRIPGKIDNGMINVRDLESKIRKSYSDVDEKYDLEKVVISSNTDARFVRYIFPVKGAFEISIIHKDEPGAMRELVKALNELGYNILLSRISKSVPSEYGEGFSLTVAICEPVDYIAAMNDLSLGVQAYREKISEIIDEKLNYSKSPHLLEYMYEVVPERVSLGRLPSEVKSNVNNKLSIREVIVPQEYRKYLKTYISSRKVIFVSQISDLEREEHSTGRRVRDAVYSAIEESGHVVFDGYSRPSKLLSKEPTEILSRAWRSDAGLFIGFGVNKPQWLTPDQTVEWGVLHGLTGRTVICTDGNSIKKKMLMMPEKIEIIVGDMQKDGEFLNLKTEIKSYLDGWFKT